MDYYISTDKFPSNFLKDTLFGNGESVYQQLDKYISGLSRSNVRIWLRDVMTGKNNETRSI